MGPRPQEAAGKPPTAPAFWQCEQFITLINNAESPLPPDRTSGNHRERMVDNLFELH